MLGLLSIPPPSRNSRGSAGGQAKNLSTEARRLRHRPFSIHRRVDRSAELRGNRSTARLPRPGTTEASWSAGRQRRRTELYLPPGARRAITRPTTADLEPEMLMMLTFQRPDPKPWISSTRWGYAYRCDGIAKG